jgi:hypothetical protein
MGLTSIRGITIRPSLTITLVASGPIHAIGLTWAATSFTTESSVSFRFR